MQRRDFFKNSALLSGIGMLGGAALPQPAEAAPAPKQPRFSSKFVDHGGANPQKHLTYYNYEKQAWFRKDNTVVTAYRANASQKYPYWYPLAGPKTGLSLVAETAQPWPHHRGIFFGCDHVNGANYWQNAPKDGQILSQGFALQKIGETGAVFTDRCLWRQPGKEPIIEDKRRYELTFLDANRYVFDAFFEILPLTKVIIKKSNHALFGVRSAPDISVVGGGTLETSAGLKLFDDGKGKFVLSTGESIAKNDRGVANFMNAVHGKPARWLSFHGNRAGLGIREGVAVMTPEGLPEPFDKNLWFFRNYGNISPMPMLFIKDKITLEKGAPLQLRYRVVAYAGTPQDANLNGLWDEFNGKKS
jgi:hypothetical protein